MRKNVLLTLCLASLLILSGCSSYGEFILVEDSESAETIFEDYKSRNEKLENVDGMVSKIKFEGSYVNENDETISISASDTRRVGIENTKYASDCTIEYNDGIYNTHTRFNETDSKYYTCSMLNFSYEKSDITTIVNCTTLYDETVMNENPVKIYTADDLVSEIENLHALSDLDYSPDMNIYTSNKGYMKVEVSDHNVTASDVTFDENGTFVEAEGWMDDMYLEQEIQYSADFDSIDMEAYEERDDEYVVNYTTYLEMFLNSVYGSI